MATQAQKWINRRRRLESHQLQAIYHKKDIVIALRDMICGIKKGDMGHIQDFVFPRGSSYKVTFEGRHIFQGKHTCAVPIEYLNLR